MIKLKNILNEARVDWEKGDDKEYIRNQYINHVKKIGDDVNRMIQSTSELTDGAPRIKYSGIEEDTYYPQSGDVGFDEPYVSYEMTWKRKVPMELNGQKVTEDQYFELYVYGTGTGTDQIELSGYRRALKVPGILNKLKRAFAYIAGKSVLWKYGKGTPDSKKSNGITRARKGADGAFDYDLQATIEPGAGDMFSKSSKKVAEEMYPFALAIFAPIEVVKGKETKFAEFVDNPDGWDKDQSTARQAAKVVGSGI